MNRARAALGSAPSSGLYRFCADAAAQTERRHPVCPTADRSAAAPGRELTKKRWDPVPAERASLPYFCARRRAQGIPEAWVARNFGRTAALSAESVHVRRVAPTSVLQDLGRVLHGDLAALARAGAIVSGLGFTATGLLRIRWTRPAGPPQEVGSTLRNILAGAIAGPVLPLVIDVNSPLGAIDARLRVGHQTARHHGAGAGSSHLAEWLRGYHPAIGQPPVQSAAASGPGRQLQ